MVVRSAAVLVSDFVLIRWRFSNPRQCNEAMRQNRLLCVPVLERIDHIPALMLLRRKDIAGRIPATALGQTLDAPRLGHSVIRKPSGLPPTLIFH